MADFLCVLSSPAAAAEAQERFLLGLALAHELQSLQPATVKSGPGFHAAGFSRRDGSGGRVAVDPDTGCWAVAAGTWFHADGFASGAEQRLIARWLDAGIDALARELDGSFAIAIGDPRTGDAFVITDAVGTRFAFVRKERASTIIGTSSLVLAGIGDAGLDPVGVQEMMRTGCSYEGRTAWKSVTRLLGGRIHRFRAGRLLRSTAHWSAGDASLDRLDGLAAADALHAVVGRVATRIHALEPRILADLTGGYDSRAVLASFLGAGVAPATTVSGAPDSDDVRVAAEVAREAGVAHHYVPGRPAFTLAELARVLPFTDGEYDSVEYSSILSVHAAHAHLYGASVAGSAGEIARGRWWMHLMPRIGRRGAIDVRRLIATRFGDNRADASLFPKSSRLDLPDHYAGIMAREVSELAHLPNTTQADALFLSLRMSAWQGRVASSTDRLRRCLTPFLFRSVLDTSLSMTVAARYRSRAVREMLHRHAPALARIPLTRGYPPLPFRPSTALAFRGLPVWYGKRIGAKLARKAGFRVALAPTAGVAASSRLALWLDDAVRDHLDPKSMALAPLFESGRLDSFLRESRAPSFAFEGAWNRMLTLEAAQRRVAEARLAVRVPRAVPAATAMFADGGDAIPTRSP